MSERRLTGRAGHIFGDCSTKCLSEVAFETLGFLIGGPPQSAQAKRRLEGR